MGGDNLDARLEPLAELLLVLIVMIMVAAVASYLIVRVINRRKQKAHEKLSASRRGRDTGINLFSADNQEAIEEAGRSAPRKPRKRSSFNLLGFLREVSNSFERPKSRRRGKRGKRSTGSSSNRIDILKKPEPGTESNDDRLTS